MEQTADREEESTDILWRVLPILHPPTNSFRKIAYNMIEHIVSRYIHTRIFKIFSKNINKLVFNMLDKHLSALRQKQPSEIMPAILQMI